jgi:hypothetical protein
MLRGLHARIRRPELREPLLEGERLKQVVRRTITPEMNCIDVGAHLGTFDTPR